MRHFIDAGYTSSGLDINQPMLDKAAIRCPQAHFALQDMCGFTVSEPLDLITCFLYSIHYSGGIERLKACIASAYAALEVDGLFCFNVVDKGKIDNSLFTAHSAHYADGQFTFSSGWHYASEGDTQELLQPYFAVHVLEHDYQKLILWDGVSGNALFAA